MTEMETDSLRDPHAYSGGYERASGSYALPAQRQVVLADEAIFVGIWMDRFEWVGHENGEGAELEGFAWLGNSYRRLLLQAQIETVEGEVEEGEVDLLYSHAVSPFWDIRAGLHRSFGEHADRDWAAIGFKGLAPYWIEIDAALHLGDSGRTAFDVEIEYELLLTQRLVLQPRIDIKAFSKTDIELGRGSGLSTIKAGARLRYEFDRQFAPYLGVERVKRFGETADLLPLGSSQTETHWVLGLRFWY
jgi:copper resistance protein B